MATRVRQQYNIVQGSVLGIYKVTDGARWYGPYQVTPISARSSGLNQTVVDDYSPSPIWTAEERKLRRTQRVIPKRRPRFFVATVPPLRAVQMSKIEFMQPGKRRVKYWNANASGSMKINAEGINLGMVPLSQGVNWECKPPSSPALIDVDLKVYSYLLQRCYSKMSTAQYDFGVTVGEVAETASMLAGPLRSIVTTSAAALAGVRAIFRDGIHVSIAIAKNATSRERKRLLATTKKHPVNSALRVVDESANHWLAWKFGVIPFIEDVGKVIEFKEKGVLPSIGLRSARVMGPALELNYPAMGVGQNFEGGWNLTFLSMARGIDRHHCGLYFRNKITSPIVNFLETIGLSPFQLPSLAYELIPLSFVVDRFIDIKSFVRGNIGSLSKDTFGSYCTRKISWTYSSTVHQAWWGGVNPDSLLAADEKLQGNAIYYQMARRVNLDRPNFPVVNPYWRDQLVADATNLALIWGRLQTFVGR